MNRYKVDYWEKLVHSWRVTVEADTEEDAIEHALQGIHTIDEPKLIDVDYKDNGIINIEKEPYGKHTD